MVEETWYNAQEALDSGLADSILPTEDKKAEEATNRWDLSIFAHAGRENAPSPREIREKITLLHNRATKEAPVGKPTNTTPTQDPEEAPGTGQPGGTEGDDPTKGTQQQPGADPAPADQPTQPPGTTQPEPQPDNKGLVNLSVGGTNFSVPAPVAQHISTLENFRDETVKSGRKNFVASLAAGPKPKVVASQIEKLEELALSLSPEQFETWKASWDAAPGHALLGNHGQGVSNARRRC
jgi:hypothetical protein